jgi:hypothetical protein
VENLFTMWKIYLQCGKFIYNVENLFTMWKIYLQHDEIKSRLS